jgi:hypothetical protein
MVPLSKSAYLAYDVSAEDAVQPEPKESDNRGHHDQFGEGISNPHRLTPFFWIYIFLNFFCRGM